MRLRIVRTPADLNSPTPCIIPGSKNTLADLDYLRRSGLAERIAELAAAGQGARSSASAAGSRCWAAKSAIRWPSNRRAGQCRAGWDCSDAVTVMAAEKTLVRTTARHAPSGLEVAGYEIHHGQTRRTAATPLLVRRPTARWWASASRDGRVWGTYLHGVFDADAFRRWFIDRLRVAPRPAAAGPGDWPATTSSRPWIGWPTWSARACAMDDDLSPDGIAMRLEYQILAAVALDLVLGDPALAAAPGPRHRPAGRGLEALAAARCSAPTRVWPALAGRRWQSTPWYRRRWRRWGGDLALAGRWSHPLAGRRWSPILIVIYTTIAARDLARHSMAVFRAAGGRRPCRGPAPRGAHRRPRYRSSWTRRAWSGRPWKAWPRAPWTA